MTLPEALLNLHVHVRDILLLRYQMALAVE
jgi:hypothetical protein